MMRRRAPRPTRGGRTTGTPRARTRPTKDRISGRDRTMGPRPVRKRPTKTSGTLQGGTASSTAKTMTSAADAARLAKLKEVMKKRAASDRAGKARSTGTPKARVKRKPLTQSMGSPMDKAPRAVGRPRRSARPIR